LLKQVKCGWSWTAYLPLTEDKLIHSSHTDYLWRTETFQQTEITNTFLTVQHINIHIKEVCHPEDWGSITASLSGNKKEKHRLTARDFYKEPIF
jgi:hypothetical protein